MRRARMMLALLLLLTSAPVEAGDGKCYLIIHAEAADGATLDSTADKLGG